MAAVSCLDLCGAAVGVGWSDAEGEAAGATVRTTADIAVARICFELDLLKRLPRSHLTLTAEDV